MRASASSRKSPTHSSAPASPMAALLLAHVPPGTLRLLAPCPRRAGKLSVRALLTRRDTSPRAEQRGDLSPVGDRPAGVLPAVLTVDEKAAPCSG